uniref:Nucleolar protein 16 n=1 Tax=Dromaius novaehollandiae TaxID=8790 RepID=A0A8C4KAE0_DRONO
MPKVKGKSRRQKFAYNVDRKRLYRSARRRAAPRIECSHVRHAWDPAKSVAQNLADMGLAEDPNKAVPITRKKLLGTEMEIDGQEKGKKTVRKPYVLNEMEYEASLPEKKSNTLSRDLIDYVRYMIQNHGENYKVGTGCPRARRTWSFSLLATAEREMLMGLCAGTYFPAWLMVKGRQRFEPRPDPCLTQVPNRSQPGWTCLLRVVLMTGLAWVFAYVAAPLNCPPFLCHRKWLEMRRTTTRTLPSRSRERSMCTRISILRSTRFLLHRSSRKRWMCSDCPCCQVCLQLQA